MKITTVELAEIFGISQQSIRKRATREQWQPQARIKIGGNVYDLDTLPLSKDERRRIQSHLRAKVLDGPLAAISAGPEVALPTETGHPQPPAAAPAMTPRMAEKMQHKAALLALYTKALAAAGWGDKVKARLDFEQAYNSGLAWPHLYNALGPVSWKTLEGWRMKVKRSNNDCFSLADRRGAHLRGTCGLTQEQTDIFLHIVLRSNKHGIAESFRIASAVMAARGISNPHSEATYRRWLHHWKSRNYDVWVWCREGSKAWNDQCAYYIERNIDVLNVGDVIVADGHNLNFEIINPWTGKPQNHMTLILFYDMASNMPLGWEIMPTENTAAISSALRRAILRLGMYPRVVYIDNGRAFRARFFAGSSSFDEVGFAGLYERIGCQTIHAWPYHGQSKTIERFFGTFSELERLLPTYTGTSIETKPPRMMRGEKKHRRLHEQQFGDRCLTIEEAHVLVATWFDAYADRPQGPNSHLAGKRPADVFAAGRGLGVDRAELTWLMMSMDIKTIHRNGITFRGEHYYHPELAGRRHSVQIRYDLQDTSSLWVFDQAGTLLCEATPVEQVHPAAAQLGTEADKEQLRRHIEYKRAQEKQAASTATDLLRLEVLPEHRRQMEGMGVLVAADNTAAVARQPEKVIRLDHERARLEADEMMRLTAEAEAHEFRDGLMRLDESDRYERLLELDAQGVELEPEWTGYMTFFEQTPAYLNHPEYWESCRIKYGLMWRKAGSPGA